MGRRGTGPCGCFGLTLEQGSQIFAIFDIVSTNENVEHIVSAISITYFIERRKLQFYFA